MPENLFLPFIHKETMTLQTCFEELTEKYTASIRLIEKLWHEVEQAYSEPNRFYHTLVHLKHLLVQLTEVKSGIKDWDTTIFALFYHDAVYKNTSSKNEEASADLASKRLLQIGYHKEKIEQCAAMIIATKTHAATNDSDADFFTDADLSILGASEEQYNLYTKQIRKEYSIYPDFIYKSGRKKVAQHFLQMKAIFKTEHFYKKFEAQARKNLEAELAIL